MFECTPENSIHVCVLRISRLGWSNDVANIPGDAADCERGQ